jgi:hypothetical protein
MDRERAHALLFVAPHHGGVAHDVAEHDRKSRQITETFLQTSL